MALVVPAKDKKRLESIARVIQRGYYRYYNKYINVKKGSIVGLTMVLAGYMLFTAFPTRSSSTSGYAKKLRRKRISDPKTPTGNDSTGNRHRIFDFQPEP
ncbi:hypothetical protein H8959_012788 [Pygathrix nigripes]